jgi:flagellar hook-associated protein 3 FlgL
MTGRITTEMVSNTLLGNINNSLTGLERTSTELSSGRRIQQPSDNPYGASRVIDLQSQLDGLASYASNVQEGTSWENTATGAMSNMGDVLQRVRELVVQASNGTNNQGNLNSIAAEVEQLTEAVKQDANTQYAGQYVFSGTATTTAPYQSGATDTFHGNEATIARAIGPGSSVTINTNISTLLGNGAGANDGKLLDTLRTIALDLRAGSREALSSTGLTQLDSNRETLSQLQATAGSVTNQLAIANTRIEGLQGSITASLAGINDTNIAEASIKYSNEQAAYTAALKSGATLIQESLLNFLK